MKIILEPSVYVIGRQTVDQDELTRFLTDIGAASWFTDAPSDGEALVEIASRLCYNSYAKPRPGGNKAHIGHILEVGHGSVTEHAVWTLLITGISRSLTHELVRHRVGISPSQLSQRFYDESDASFVVPPALGGADHSVVWDVWRDTCLRCLAAYRDMVLIMEGATDFLQLDPTMRRKRARECARSVLPNCVETRIALTGNARAFRHVLELRGSDAADLEIRRLAVKLADIFKGLAPNLFADVQVVHDEDGRESVVLG